MQYDDYQLSAGDGIEDTKIWQVRFRRNEKVVCTVRGRVGKKKQDHGTIMLNEKQIPVTEFEATTQADMVYRAKEIFKEELTLDENILKTQKLIGD